MSSRFLACAVGLLVSVRALADAPAGYYDPALGLVGTALRGALHGIIDGHTVVPYSSSATDTSDALRVLDRDPANSANVLTIYSGISTAASGFATTWNREHLWPNSYGLDSVQPAYSDLFNLRPELSGVNSSRGNLFYDTANPADPGYRVPGNANAPLTARDSDSWQPPVSVRGDIARALFYMDVRYEAMPAPSRTWS